MNGRFLWAWRLTLAGAAVVVLTVLVTLATGCSNGSDSVTGTGATMETKPYAAAPEFNAESLGGGTLALTDLVAAGKPILITFGASW